MKNRSYRYDINRPGSRQGHKYSEGVIQKVRSSCRLGSLKSELKQTGGGGSSLSVRTLCEKKLPDFQTA